MDIKRTRWIVCSILQDGYVYCEKGGWVSMRVISKSDARIMSFASLDEAKQYFPNAGNNVHFIEVGEYYYSLNN